MIKFSWLLDSQIQSLRKDYGYEVSYSFRFCLEAVGLVLLRRKLDATDSVTITHSPVANILQVFPFTLLHLRQKLSTLIKLRFCLTVVFFWCGAVYRRHIRDTSGQQIFSVICTIIWSERNSQFVLQHAPFSETFFVMLNYTRCKGG